MTKRLVPPLVYLQVQTAEVVPGTSKSAGTSEAEIYKDLKTPNFFFSFFARRPLKSGDCLWQNKIAGTLLKVRRCDRTASSRTSARAGTFFPVRLSRVTRRRGFGTGLERISEGGCQSKAAAPICFNLWQRINIYARRR